MCIVLEVRLGVEARLADSETHHVLSSPSFHAQPDHPNRPQIELLPAIVPCNRPPVHYLIHLSHCSNA